LSPDRGEIKLAGVDVTKLSRSKREILLGAADPNSVFIADRTWRFDRGGLAVTTSRELRTKANIFPLISPKSSGSKASGRVYAIDHAVCMPDDVKQLLATEAALDKLGARGISTAEAGQML
jgi:hypothetical protein